jgi:hypothetical protein
MYKCEPFAINKIMKENQKKIKKETDNSMKIYYVEQFIKKKIIANKIYAQQEKYLLKVDVLPKY